MDDWGDAVHNFIANPHKVISEAVDNVSEAVSDLVGDVCGQIVKWGNEYSEIRVKVIDVLKEPFHYVFDSALMFPITYATQQGSMDDILEDVDFHRDTAGIFHTSVDCWQQYLGYNDLYDWAFEVGTDMKKGKYPFTDGNEEYCIWMWKGDYLNLGAGAETGIYKGGEPHWNTMADDALDMTLALYDKDGNTIMCYIPSDPQWWVTGFDPMTQNPNVDDLQVIGSIDLTKNPKLWKAFKKRYAGRNKKELCFDEDNQTLYYNW